MLQRSILMVAACLLLYHVGHTFAQTTANLEFQATAVTESAFGEVGKPFVLDGSRSADDGTISTFAWKQVSGPFKFSLASGAKISVVPSVAGTYVFELVVTDRAGESSVVKKVQVAVAEKSEYVVQNNETNLDFINKPATTPSVTPATTPAITLAATPAANAGGTQDINIGIGEQKKGNVDYTWKVEEGEKSRPASSVIDTINTGTPNSGAAKGNVEVTWKVEEGEKLTPVFLEIDTIKGESPEAESTGKANDRLVNAGPRDGWPAGGVSVAVGDINGLTEEQKKVFLATVKTWAEVNSEQDLQNFAVGVMMAQDQPAETLSLNYEEIKFTYAMPAKLFGFIPTSYKAEVSVNRGNNENWDFARVKVRLPWYSFLMRKGTSQGELSRAIQQGAEAEMNAGTAPSANDAGSWKPGAARAMRLVSNVIKTRHDTVKNSIGNVR